MNDITSVIAAVSTPPGKGGVAIIRISGDGSHGITERIFKPRSGKDINSYPKRMQIWGDIIRRGEIIDDGMATLFSSPFSYTGEDMVEISCHGGRLVTEAVLEAIIAEGARIAEPGEFTRRAFINGKLSLTEAEGIGALLEAESREQMKLSSIRSRELLAGEIKEIRELLTSILSSIYARIDYPDEDLGDFTDREMLAMLTKADERISQLRATYRTGKAVSEGIKTVICGKPNVGKSSIYNLLVGRDAAIVTDIPGTTRDVLCENIPLGRVMLRLSDTAGMRDTDATDTVEKIGISRSRDEIEKAELILAVFDLSRDFDESDADVLAAIKNADGTRIAILNKCDTSPVFDKSKLGGLFESVIEISAKVNPKDARDGLTRLIDALFTDEKITVGEEAIISSARQMGELTRASELIATARAAILSGTSVDAASSDVELALGAIAELDGKAVSEEVVADIFSKFCVGK